MTNFYNGRKVWLTGASSGIGEALAYQLAEQGAELVLSSRRKEALLALCKRLPHPHRHEVLVLDLAHPEALFKQVTDEVERGRRVDLLINNAGISQRGRAEDTRIEVDRKLLEVNYLGTVAMTKALLPTLLSSERGIVATVASVSGLVGSQGRSTYSAAKHALIGFMESLRAEMYSKGLQVTVVCPGWVNTQISINALNEVGQPLGKMEPCIAKGISAEMCARKILLAIKRGRDQAVIGSGMSVLAPAIKRFFPGLFQRLNRKQAYR